MRLFFTQKLTTIEEMSIPQIYFVIFEVWLENNSSLDRCCLLGYINIALLNLTYVSKNIRYLIVDCCRDYQNGLKVQTTARV